MNESSFWHYIKNGMQGRWFATRIESSAGNGVPDVCFAVTGKIGFIELKYIKEWPKRTTTPVKLPLRPEQRLWIRTVGAISGDIWVMCRVADEFFLFDWKQAVLSCDGWIREDWSRHATEHWTGRIDFELLQFHIQEGRQK